MPVLIGTRDGVYLADDVPFDEAEPVLDGGQTHRLHQFEEYDGILAATEAGLHRSVDGGRSWERITTPETDIWEAIVTADGKLYAGSMPARLFMSTDGGGDWFEIETIHDHPSRPLWRSAFGVPRFRGMASHRDSPDRIVVGVEAGGLFITEDAGKTWSKCRLRAGNTVDQTDIHQVVTLSPDEYLVPAGRLSIYDRNHAAADGGLYLTRDRGTTWSRLDAKLDPNYYREVLVHGGRLYACGALTVPPEWPTTGADASLFESADMGETFESVPFPGGPDEMILSWAGSGDLVLGGTAVGDEGRVIHRTGDREWGTAGTVPDDVTALTIV